MSLPDVMLAVLEGCSPHVRKKCNRSDSPYASMASSIVVFDSLLRLFILSKSLDTLGEKTYNKLALILINQSSYLLPLLQKKLDKYVRIKFISYARLC